MISRDGVPSAAGDGDDVTPRVVGDLAMQIKALRTARSILCGKNPPIPAVLEAAGIVAIVKALDCSDLQYRALRVLTRIAFESFKYTNSVINSGAIAKLMTFLTYDDDLADWRTRLADRAILTLGSFALHSPEVRDAVLEHGAVTAMMPYLRTDTPVRRLRTCVRTLSNLCSHADDDQTNFELISPVLPCIHDILDIENEETLDPDDKEIPYIACDILVDACTALTNMMQGPDECIEAVQAVPGLTARLVALLGHEASGVKEAALSAVGNMLAGIDVQVDRCLEADCLDHIVSLLQSSNTSLVKDAARAISNILAGTPSQIQLALEKDVLTPLKNILANGDPECQKQAVYAVTYLCYNGSAEQHSQLVSRGVLPPYCALLAAPGPAGDVLDGLNELIKEAERDGNVKPLCYMLDELDVLDQMQELKERITDEDSCCKLANVSATIRKHSREERFVVKDEEQFTSKKIVEGLDSQQLATQLRASSALHCILLETHPPVNALLEAGIMAPIVKVLDRDACSKVHHFTVRALSQITSGTSKHRMAVVNGGAIFKLMGLLVKGDEIAELASCSLGNIALHGPETRDAVLAYVQSETALIELRTYVRAYNSLCSPSDEATAKLQLALEALPFVAELLDIGDQEILENVCQACANLLPGPDNLVEPVQGPGLAARLVALLGHEAAGVREPALLAVANMLAGTDAQADRCLDAGCLNHVTAFLQCGNPFLIRSAVLATRNIFRRSHAYIQQALDKDILTPLRNVLTNGETQCQKEAAGAITVLCTNGSAEQHSQLVSRGVLPPYCALLAADLDAVGCVLDGLGGMLQVVEKNGKVIKHLCQKLDELGVIDQLQQFLQEQDIAEELRLKAAQVSATILRQARDELVVVEDGILMPLAKIVKDMSSEELATLQRAVRAAHRMLDNRDAPRVAMVKAGVVPPLVAVLDREDCSDLRFMVVCALVNLTTWTHGNRVAVLNSGAVPKLIALISEGGKEAEPASWTLGNLCLNALMTRDQVLRGGAVRAMLPHMRVETPLSLLRSIMATYMNLCRKIIDPDIFELVLPALPSLSELLNFEDHAVQYFACAALGNLTHGLLENIAPVQAVAGLTARVVALLGHEQAAVKEAALCTIANMLIGTNAQADLCLEAGCLDGIVPLLYSSNPALLERAVRATGNIVAGTPSHIQQALNKGILVPLLNILDGAEPNSYPQYNALRAISNIAARGTNEQRMVVVNCGLIPKLVSLVPHRVAVTEQTIRALGYLAAAGPAARDPVLAAGAVPAMLPYIRADTPQNLLFICVRAYKIFCSHDDDKSTETLKHLSPALPYISTLLRDGVEDEHVLEQVCWALVGLTSSHEGVEAVQAVAGLTAQLAALLGHVVAKVKSVAIIALIYMLSGTDDQVDRCLEAGCVKHILSYLKCRDPALLQPAADATKQVLGETHPLLQRALDKDVLTPLMAMLGYNSEDQKRTVKAISNLCCRASSSQRARLVSRGVLQPCCALLAAPGAGALRALGDYLQVAVNDHNLKEFCLKLHEMGVLDQIKQLQEHEDEEVKEEACRLLQIFSSLKREEDDNQDLITTVS